IGRTSHRLLVLRWATQHIAAEQSFAGRFRTHIHRVRRNGEREQMDRGFQTAHAWPPAPDASTLTVIHELAIKNAQ
ncbi:MAG: hypothetical protein JF591_14155, partial [Lysobacter sp.]|nr:hypothetical protein [Lysobacter sp.]